VSGRRYMQVVGCVPDFALFLFGGPIMKRSMQHPRQLPRGQWLLHQSLLRPFWCPRTGQVRPGAGVRRIARPSNHAGSCSGQVRPGVGVWVRLWSVLLVGSLLGACAQDTPAPSEPQTIKILSTSDIHGWLNARLYRKSGRFAGGMAELVHALRTKEGLRLKGTSQTSPRPYLLLDSGDMWTGPAESTLLEGAPMVTAFNLMDYDAAALGNHEFDFGQDVLRAHAAKLTFPILAANLAPASKNQDMGFRKHSLLVNVAGMKVGIVGLALKGTPKVTFPTRVAGLVFTDYLPAIRREARALLAQGAVFLVVLGHIEQEEMLLLAEATQDLPIRAFLGGHTHRQELEVLTRGTDTLSDDVIVMTAGCYARAYGRLELTFQDAQLVGHQSAIIPVEGVLEGRSKDREMAAIVNEANRQVQPRLAEPMGVLLEAVSVGDVDDSPMGRLVADSWLTEVPQADIAITNLGGLRQSLDPGPVTAREILGVLPFANDLVLLELTPGQIREAIDDSSMLVGGMRYHFKLENGRRTVTALMDLEGKPLDEKRAYKVVTTDFLYEGGDGRPFKRQDPTPVMLGINWRAPLMQVFKRAGAEGLRIPRGTRSLPESG